MTCRFDVENNPFYRISSFFVCKPFSHFSHFKKSRDAACYVKITHPSSISLFVFICINMSWCACLCFPLSLRPYLFLKNQKRASCTSTCVYSLLNFIQMTKHFPFFSFITNRLRNFLLRFLQHVMVRFAPPSWGGAIVSRRAVKPGLPYSRILVSLLY